MAADLSDFAGDETDSHIRSKRLSFVAMGNDNTSPVSTSSPISAPTRATPPNANLTLERPMLESFMTPASTKTSAGLSASRQLVGLDHELAKFAQQVRPFWLPTAYLIQPLARAATVVSLIWK